LHVPTLLLSDPQYEHWFTKRVKGERPLRTNSGYKIIVKFIIIIGENGIISDIQINGWSMWLELTGIFKCFKVKT